MNKSDEVYLLEEIGNKYTTKYTYLVEKVARESAENIAKARVGFRGYYREVEPDRKNCLLKFEYDIPSVISGLPPTSGVIRILKIQE